jgi:SNF2 family DNA or RNA helicase
LQSHKYHSVILDEAQAIKNHRSKMSQLVRQLDAGHRLCLTGTPLENHLGELWALYDFLMPGFLGDAQAFARFYRTPIEKHGDHARRQHLARRVQPFLLRREKDEVATELPPKTEILQTVKFDRLQAELYEGIRVAMDKRVRDAIASQGLARSHITILDALLKLRQVCCDPRLLKLDRAQNQQVQSAKLELLLDLLPEQLEEGRRVLLFSQFTSMLGLIEIELKQRGIGYSKLTGQTRKRDAAIQRFREGEVDLFLISLKAGGTGLNLTEADTVILYDPWWNPAVETQAVDRAHRIGQDKPVFIYKLVVENSVEEIMLAMQARKRALARGIYAEQGSHEATLMNAETLYELFAPLGS